MTASALGLAPWAVLVLGILFRAAAAVDDATRLKRAEEPVHDDGLSGSYVTIRFGAVLIAIGTVLVVRDLLGAPALVIAVLAAPPLLVVSDLLPRALTSPESDRRAGGWTAAVGRAARSIEQPLTGPEASAWTHMGLAPLVRKDAAGEDAAEHHMARRVYDFGDVVVGDIMVPLVDVIAVREDSPIDEVVRIATREGFSRLPVFHERLPNVIGLLHVFDLLAPGGARTAEERMHAPTFVPEMTLASDVLRRLQVEGVNLAVVVDEYGGAVGIVAIEDILEEVVGEIEDEYDEPEDPVREIGAGTWIVDGRAEIERLNERFAWELPEGEYETLGGLLLANLARIPEVGDALTLERVALRVTAASPRSVDEIRVDALEPGPNGREGASS